MADDNVARCAHLLLKHTGSRNPVSRRTNQRITMTKAEALAGEVKRQNFVVDDM